MNLAPLFPQFRPAPRILFGANNETWKATWVAIAVSVLAAGTSSADTQSTFSTTATDLSVGANYTPAIVPTAAPAVDVQLTGPRTGGNTLTVTGSALNYGTLNNLNTTQPITITNTTGVGSITLNSVANGTVGANAADLIYNKAGGNLSITNGTGLTVILNNSGNIHNDGILAVSAPVTITAGNTITFTGGGGTTVSGNIGATTGAIAVNAAGGSVILSGTNGYTGGTAINNGALAVGSAGALGAGSVTNSSTLETTATTTPGSGALAIHDNATYTQTPTGTLALQVVTDQGGPTTTQTAAGVDYDTLAVLGNVSLAGIINLNFETGAAPVNGERFQVASSASAPIAGTIPVTVTGAVNPAFIAYTTYNDSINGTYAPNSVVVTLLAPFTSAGLTHNQLAVANNIDGQLNTMTHNGVVNVTPGANQDFFNNIVTGLTISSSTGTLGKSLDELSPQRFEVLQNVAFDNYAFDIQSLDNEFARERDGQGGIDTSGFAFNNAALGPQLSEIKGRLLAWAPAPESHGLLSDSSQSVLGGVTMTDPKDVKQMTTEAVMNKWNGFVDGGVDLGDLDHNSDVSHANYTTGRVRGGVDYLVAQNLRVGAFFGYGHTDVDLDEEGSKATVNSYTPGVFATYADKHGFYANGIFTYTRNDYSTDRNIIIPGVDRTASGSPSGDQFGGDLDGGYEFHKGAWTFGPSAGLTYVNYGVDSFNESGAGSANLSVNSQSAESLRSRVGGTIRYDAKIGSMTVTPHLSAYWQHEFLDGGNSITSQFEGLPANSFSVQTTDGDSDDALLGFGIDAQVTNSLTLFVDYETEAGGSTFFGQSATGGLRVNF